MASPDSGLSDSVRRWLDAFVAEVDFGLAAVMGDVDVHGEKHFECLQLFTSSLPASRFYESLSYARVQDRWKVSHAKQIAP